LINEILEIEAGEGDDTIPENFNLVEASKVVFGDNRITAFVKKVNKLDMHARLLHLLICQVFNMRSGSFALISKDDMYLMYKIVQRDPPSLGTFIARRMVRAVKWSKKANNNLAHPYGQLVSKIIQKLCNVPSNEFVEHEPTLPIVNEAAFGRMNFVFNDRTNTWMKKEDMKKRKEPETETDTAAGTPTAAATETAQEAGTAAEAGPSTLATREVTNRELNAMMLRRFTVIDNMLTRMDARLGKMGGKLEDLEAQIWEIKERLPLEDEEDEIDSDDMMTP